MGGHRHAPAALSPGMRPDTYCMADCVGPWSGLDGCGKISPPTGIRSPGCPARSESLYRLSYPDPRVLLNIATKWSFQPLPVSFDFAVEDGRCWISASRQRSLGSIEGTFGGRDLC